MTARITRYPLLLSLIFLTGISASGQYPQPSQQPYAPGTGPYQQNQQPTQRVAPSQGAYRGPAGQAVPPGASAIVPQNTPRLERRAPQTVNAPFRLTPAEQAEVDDVLKKWEEASKKHKRIVIEFARFEYMPAFAPAPNVPLHIDQGKADFASSGKWMWSITGEWVDNELIKGQRAELMMFDGDSIYEFNYPGKLVTRHLLGPDMKGEDMVRAMLPFLFGTDRNELMKRYFIRLTKLADKDAICIDAWPRFQDEARNFKMARMRLDLSKMEPTGLLLMMPNGTDYYSYKFEKVDINPKNPLDLLNDPWKVKIPAGWTTRVEQMPGPQMGNRAADPVR